MQHSSSRPTDELSVSATLNGGQYTISDIKGSSNNSYNYHAKTADGTLVAIKEFFLRDMCRRNGTSVQVAAKPDAKVFNNLVKTFMRDATFLTSLDSEHLANVLDLFEENGTAYMVKSIPDGALLADLIADPSHSFTPKKIASIANDLARALVEIHGFGMLHRDITPNNIMITTDGSAVLLPDFGTFREDRSNASRVVSSVLQSAQHYAPFELTFDDARQGDGSDIYCIAAVVYHLITGQPPAASLDRVAAVAANDPDPYEPLEGKYKKHDARFLKAMDMSLELFYDARVHSATELMFIMSKDIDFDETRRMKRDVGKRSTPLTQQGIFTRVKNLLLRR
jgi:serine/threonine protein kinase